MEAWPDLFQGAHDKGHVGVFGLTQWRRDTDAHRVHLGEFVEIGRRPQPLARHELAHSVISHIAQVGHTAVDLIDPVLVHLESHDVEARACKFHGERQANVTQADDGDAGSAILDLRA